LHIPPEVADTSLKIILAYLLIGSYGILFSFWWQKRKATISLLAPQKATGPAS
jgi:hypothetical protein